jgi:hypothetical protein
MKHNRAAAPAWPVPRHGLLWLTHTHASHYVAGNCAKSLLIIVVDDLICEVIRHPGTRVRSTVRDGIRHKMLQSFVKVNSIVGEIEIVLAGGGKNGRPVCRLQRRHISLRRVPHVNSTEVKVKIVENVGDVTLRQIRRGRGSART